VTFISLVCSSSQLEAAAATVKQFEALRKRLEEQCASVPKLQQEVVELKKKLQETLAVAAGVLKMEQTIKNFTADHGKLKDEAAAAQDLRIQVSSLEQKLVASDAALRDRERALRKLSDEAMASKLQAALKLKTEKFQVSPGEAAKELLQDVAYWRKKCINAESELHELKVAIAADARRSFLALALAPPLSPTKNSSAGARGI